MDVERGSIKIEDLWILTPIAIGLVCVGTYGAFRWDDWFPEREKKPTSSHIPTASAIGTETPGPSLLPEITEDFIPSMPTPVTEENGEERNCFTIDGNHPTAWSAWEQLDRPPKVIFQNTAGPDATGASVKIEAPGGLPRLVNPGDVICAPKGFSPDKGSKPVPRSHAGFGIRP